MTSQMVLVSSIGGGAWPDDVAFEHDCYIVTGEAGHQFDAEMHTAAKPLETTKKIAAHTVGDVYDPFLGSGTTLIAAEQLDRRCYAMEIEPAYVDVSVRRWEHVTGRKAVLADALVQAHA